MKFYPGITLKRLFEVYELQVPKNFPKKILSEPLAVYGEDFLQDLKTTTREIDEKIIIYLFSKQFLEDAIKCDKELSVRDEHPYNDYWLQLEYTENKTIRMTVDMDMKEF